MHVLACVPCMPFSRRMHSNLKSICQSQKPCCRPSDTHALRYLALPFAHDLSRPSSPFLCGAAGQCPNRGCALCCAAAQVLEYLAAGVYAWLVWWEERICLRLNAMMTLRKYGVACGSQFRSVAPQTCPAAPLSHLRTHTRMQEQGAGTRDTAGRKERRMPRFAAAIEQGAGTRDTAGSN